MEMSVAIYLWYNEFVRCNFNISRSFSLQAVKTRILYAPCWLHQTWDGKDIQLLKNHCWHERSPYFYSILSICFIVIKMNFEIKSVHKYQFWKQITRRRRKNGCIEFLALIDWWNYIYFYHFRLLEFMRNSFFQEKS